MVEVIDPVAYAQADVTLRPDQSLLHRPIRCIVTLKDHRKGSNLGEAIGSAMIRGRSYRAGYVVASCRESAEFGASSGGGGTGLASSV